MAGKALKIPWTTVWKKFNIWCDDRQRHKYCGKCHRYGSYPTWKEQRDKIQEMVDAILEERGAK